MGESTINQHLRNMSIKLQMQTLTFEAESVAFVVCQYFGIDTSEYSFPYVSSWSEKGNADTLKKSMTIIQKTSDELIQKILDELAKS